MTNTFARVHPVLAAGVRRQRPRRSRCLSGLVHGLMGVALAAIPSSAASAQPPISVIGGIQRTNFIGGGSGNYTWRTAYMVGAMGDFPLGDTFSFRPELHYSNKGSAVKTELGQVGQAAFRLSYLQMPLLGQLRTASGGQLRPHLYGGVSVGLLLRCRLAEQACGDIADFNQNRLELGLVMGSEVEGWGGALGVRYEVGLRPVDSTVQGNAIYNGALSVTFRYLVWPRPR